MSGRGGPADGHGTGGQEDGGHEYRVLDRETVFEGPIISVFRERVAMPGGAESVRDLVRHPGAVAVVALDERDHVVLLRQYRHPVRAHLWELPAGLRDEAGEPPLKTAQRELAEEAQLGAERWSLLATVYSSPGFSDEGVLIYLAEGLSEVPLPEDFVVEHEELDMTVERLPLAEAVQRVFDGDIRNASTCVGLLAAAQARVARPRLRPVDAG